MNYIFWSNYIYEVFKRSNVPNGIWCEGGCGSGNITIQLFRKGIAITGFDASEEMIQVARKKSNYQLNFEVESFHTFTFQNLAALFTVYDSMNYLLNITEVLKFFQRVYNALIPNGLFLFDLCTERNSLRNLNHWCEIQTYGDWTYWRHSWYNEENQIHYNDFEIIHSNDPTTVYVEKHMQKIYSIDEMIQTASQANFHILSVYSNTTFSRGSENDDRVHILARKLQ
ncbi:MAG: class I SAM-dependent methyltransferase [bacterium]|nr:class I SAM-dependent methyltransferase [bacterium]